MRKSTRTISILSAGLLATTLGLGATTVATSAAGSDGTSVAAASGFSGRLGCGTAHRPGTTTFRQTSLDDGTTVVDKSGVVWRFPVYEMSDPRLDGTVLGYLDGSDYLLDEGVAGVYSALWTIENDGGSWIGHYETMLFPDSQWAYSTNSIRLVGEGDYAGLYAMIETDFRDNCGWDVRGFVVEGDPPASPARLTD